MDIASAVVRAAPGRRDEVKTCIDCHKGIAHQLPPIEQAIGAPRVEPSAGKFAPPTR